MNEIDDRKIDLVLEGKANEKDSQKTLRWLSTDEGKNYLSGRLDRDAEDLFNSQKNDFDGEIPSEKMLRSILRIIRWKRRRKVLLRVAAVLIPFVLLSAQFLYFNSKVDVFSKSEYEEIIVPNGEKMQLIFQDGSKVYLNSGSKIKYPRKFAFSERKVYLDGEGFFEIKPNRSCPFIVDLYGVGIEVLGTSFNVDAFSSQEYVLVGLESGSISFHLKEEDPVLVSGESLLYNRSSGEYEITKVEDISQMSAWKKDILILNDTPLVELLEMLTKRHNRDFIIQDTAALNYNFTLISSNKDLGLILRDIERVSPVRFEESDYSFLVKMKD